MPGRFRQIAVGLLISGNQISRREDPQFQIQVVEKTDERRSGLAALDNDEPAVRLEHPQYFIQIVTGQGIIVGEVAESEGDRDAVEVAVREGEPGDVGVDEANISQSGGGGFGGGFCQHRPAVIGPGDFRRIPGQPCYGDGQVPGAAADIQDASRLVHQACEGSLLTPAAVHSKRDDMVYQVVAVGYPGKDMV